ncbi:AraC family transcriptional regulator [Cupriavidus plantarum]|uniref:AraC-like DNA-binding protein n=1 Tax=Cupriavidus plantarum TaxID=942865 RepID=A0A316F9G9_9BURK|nr:AraC family transcriptional regulator [Cupriavidus plantarum]NYI01738.1 AraC-like DNA-binding protein [Cupriavidus plantarum]PWK33874.1 AraC-like DNA-binding protein [Cupriavidus plantarum]
MNDAERAVRRLLKDVDAYVAALPGPVGRATPVPRLTVWSSSHATPQTAAVFEPMFYAVVRGTKVLTMGANRFELAAGTCAASSFGLPYSHQLTGATPHAPYVGVSLHLDIDRLSRVALEMPAREASWTCAVAAGDLNGPVGEVFTRFVGLVKTPEDIGVLAPHYETELYYRLLQSSMGDTLRQIVQRDGRVRQIKAAADWLGANNDATVTVAELAATAGMSVTSFHRHFKAVTGYSPLAFQRRVRLMEARKLLAAGSTNVSRVAYEVGYQSASQFSREYKRMFGSPPVTEAQR